MRILVTGSTGMLGTSLCRLALQKGYEVVGMSRGEKTRSLFANERHLKGDLQHKEQTLAILRAEKPKVIVHSAAQVDVDFCEREPTMAKAVNALGTAWVAEGAKEIDALLCYVSTDYVFDGESRAPYREEDPPRPVNVYARTKLEGETSVASQLAAFYIVRTSWLFGEGHDSFVHHVLNWAETKPELRLVVDKWSIPSSSRDVAEGILALIEKRPSYGIYHLSNGGGGCSWYNYGQEVLKRAGLDRPKVVPMALKELPLVARRPPMTVLNLEKFQRHVMTLRDWREALGEYLGALDLHLRRRA